MSDERLTVESVVVSVARIAGETHDAEGAHEAEDCLHQDVLKAIAEGRCDDSEACARAALETTKLDFPRWCA